MKLPTTNTKGNHMIVHAASHLDHSITEMQLAHILEVFSDRQSFFMETIELPLELGTVPCGLFGPIMGDDPVPSSEVTRAVRGSRTWESRLVAREPRPTRLVTVIGGPYGEGTGTFPCILYTVFGGPQAPREIGDPSIPDEDRMAAVEFWSEHALSAVPQ